MIRTILQHPHADLTEDVTGVAVTPEQAEIVAQNLIDTLAASETGIGLAAPQIGHRLPMFVWLHQSNGHATPRVIIHPEVQRLGRSVYRGTEGCLSYPGQQVAVARSPEVVLRGQYLNGNAVRMHLRGVEAICVQHEMDHLLGKGLWNYE